MTGAVRMWEGTGDLAALRAWAQQQGGDVFTSPASEADPSDRVVLVTHFPDRAAAEAWAEPASPAVKAHSWVFDVA